MMLLEKRFHVHYEPEPNSGCWLWTGPIINSGYGRIGKKVKWLAHRLSYTIHKGEIPEGILVLHKCDVKICVNPDHLFLGTHSDNSLDAVRKGRWTQGKKGILKNEITHCPLGHPYDDKNTSIVDRGNGRIQRRCLACAAIAARKWRDKDRKSYNESARNKRASKNMEDLHSILEHNDIHEALGI